MNTRDVAGVPIAAGILFGLGLGGFFDRNAAPYRTFNP